MSAQNEKSLTRNYKQNARIKAYQARNYKFVAQSQKALYDLDSNNDVTEPDNPHHWPKFTRKPKEVEKTEGKADFLFLLCPPILIKIFKAERASFSELKRLYSILFDEVN